MKSNSSLLVVGDLRNIFISIIRMTHIDFNRMNEFKKTARINELNKKKKNNKK